MKLVGFCEDFLVEDYLRLELGDLDDYLDLVGHAPWWRKGRFGLRHRHHAGRISSAGGLRVSRHGGIPSEAEARRTAQYILGQISSGAARLGERSASAQRRNYIEDWS